MLGATHHWWAWSSDHLLSPLTWVWSLFLPIHGIHTLPSLLYRYLCPQTTRADLMVPTFPFILITRAPTKNGFPQSQLSPQIYWLTPQRHTQLKLCCESEEIIWLYKNSEKKQELKCVSVPPSSYILYLMLGWSPRNQTLGTSVPLGMYLSKYNLKR